MKKSVVLSLLMICLLSLGGCFISIPPTPIPPQYPENPNAITSITVAPSFEFSINQTPLLQFAVLPETADKSGISFRSTDNNVIEFENNTPKLRGLGSALITILDTHTGRQAQTAITVFLGVEHFTATFPDKIFIVDKEIPVSISYLPKNAQKTNFTYVCDNSNIVQVQNNKLIPKSIGKCTVTVKNELGKEESYPLEVLDYTPTQSLALPVQKIVLSIHNPLQGLQPIIEPENASDKTLYQEEKPTDCARIEDGKIKAIKAGTSTLTLKTRDGHTASLEVEVQDYSLSLFEEGLIPFCDTNNNCGYLNVFGEIVLQGYSYCEPFFNGLALVYKDNSFLINAKGERKSGLFSQESSRIGQDLIFDRSEQILYTQDKTPLFDIIDANLFGDYLLLQKKDKSVFVTDTRGVLIFDPAEKNVFVTDCSLIFENQYFVFSDNGEKTYLFDITKDTYTEINYAQKYQNYLQYTATNDDRYVLFENQTYFLSVYQNDYLLLQDDSKIYCFDRTSSVITKEWLLSEKVTEDGLRGDFQGISARYVKTSNGEQKILILRQDRNTAILQNFSLDNMSLHIIDVDTLYIFESYLRSYIATVNLSTLQARPIQHMRTMGEYTILRFGTVSSPVYHVFQNEICLTIGYEFNSTPYLSSTNIVLKSQTENALVTETEMVFNLSQMHNSSSMLKSNDSNEYYLLRANTYDKILSDNFQYGVIYAYYTLGEKTYLHHILSGAVTEIDSCISNHYVPYVQKNGKTYFAELNPQNQIELHEGTHIGRHTIYNNEQRAHKLYYQVGNEILCLDSETKEVTSIYTLQNNVQAIYFSNTYLTIRYADKTLLVYDIQTKQTLDLTELFARDGAMIAESRGMMRISVSQDVYLFGAFEDNSGARKLDCILLTAYSDSWSYGVGENQYVIADNDNTIHYLPLDGENFAIADTYNSITYTRNGKLYTARSLASNLLVTYEIESVEDIAYDSQRDSFGIVNSGKASSSFLYIEKEVFYGLYTRTRNDFAAITVIENTETGKLHLYDETNKVWIAKNVTNLSWVGINLQYGMITYQTEENIPAAYLYTKDYTPYIPPAAFGKFQYSIEKDYHFLAVFEHGVISLYYSTYQASPCTLNSRVVDFYDTKNTILLVLQNQDILALNATGNAATYQNSTLPLFTNFANAPFYAITNGATYFFFNSSHELLFTQQAMIIDWAMDETEKVITFNHSSYIKQINIQTAEILKDYTLPQGNQTGLEIYIDKDHSLVYYNQEILQLPAVIVVARISDSRTLVLSCEDGFYLYDLQTKSILLKK